MGVLKILGVVVGLGLIVYLFLRGVRAGAYSPDRTVGGAVKSIFGRGQER